MNSTDETIAASFTPEKIVSFLSRRDGRVTTIETANILYQTMGVDSLRSGFNHPNLDVFQVGCLMQYFAFSQKTFVDFIFMNFITVIGNYDAKKEILKAWHKIPIRDICVKNSMLEQLLEIRTRYVDARNNFICHINDDMQSCSSSVSTAQISKDIATLRKIFNIIRDDNGLPIVVSAYSPSETYPVIGLNQILKILNKYP